jgi:MarR family transcriptional regulator, lower aerobic nicotinate degradation pathway regulator
MPEEEDHVTNPVLGQQPTLRGNPELQIERATLSGIVSTLVRKDLVEQTPDPVDQRQRMLRITASGLKLWAELPDLALIETVAFEGIDPVELATVVKVLQAATQRLNDHMSGGENS